MQESTELSYPLEISVIYGSDLDPSIDPEVFIIPSAGAFSAFVQGNNEADGWMEAIFVKHRNYRVDAEGDAREGKAPAKTPGANERFVIWGGKPDAGTKPQRYVFDDEDAARAFEEAVNGRVGWTASHFVPGKDFRAYRDLDHALEDVQPTVAQSLKALAEKEDEYLGEGDPLFINASGEFVQDQWAPGQPVCNRKPKDSASTTGRRTPSR